MQTFRSTVFVPLVELTHQAGTLLEVYAENQLFGATVLDNKSLDKNWNFVAAPLKEAGLYNEGLHVVSSVRKLTLKTSPWSIYQRFKKYAWLDNQRLHATNNQLDNREGTSAQLGLALALLLNASNSRTRFVLATGALSNELHADYDVAIEAVASVPEKLALIIAKRKAKLLPSQPLFCFTPTHFKQNGELIPVADLPQVEELAALAIYVKPIKWLSEAIKQLKAIEIRPLIQDRLIAGMLSVIFGTVLIIISYYSWLHYPIPIQTLIGKHKAEPFLVCSSKDNSSVSYFDLERDGNIPIFPLFAKENSDFNTGIAWKLKPEKTPLSNRYYVAYVHLGEQSGYKLISKQPGSSDDITVNSADQLNGYWPMLETSAKPQDNVLIILFQRRPISADLLNKIFAERFPVDNSLDVIKARDFILPLFPGSYAFSYQSKLSDSPCLK